MAWLKNVSRRWDDEIARLSWQDFERRLAAHYEGQGWRVEHCGTGGHARGRFDGGVDLELRRGAEFVLVQCKRWNAKQVPHNDVHQLIGVRVTRGATGAVIVTCGEFTREARRAGAHDPTLQLIDGDALRRMLADAAPSWAATTHRWDPVRDAAVDVAHRVITDALDISPRRRGRGAATNALGVLLLAKLLPVLLFVVVLLVVAGALQDFGDRVRPPRPSATQGLSSPQPRVAYPDSPAPPRLTPEEAQRRADEAMRVLAPNTPEIARMPTAEEAEAAKRRNELRSAGP